MFNNITIKARLVLLVAVLSLIMSAIGLGGIFALRNSNAALETVYADRTVPIGQLTRVIRLVNRNQISMLSAIVHGQAQFAESATQIRDAQQEMQEKWNAYAATSMTAQEKMLVADVVKVQQAFNADVIAPGLAALDAKDVEKLDGVVRQVMNKRYTPVRDAINELIKLQIDVAKVEYDIGERDYERFMLVSSIALVAGLLFGALLAYWLIRSITAPLNEAVAVAESVAAGDLTRNIAVGANDETGRLLTALQSMQAKLTAIVGEVRVSTDSITVASSEIAAGNSDLSRRTEDQAASLEETASSMEELTSTVKQNSDNAQQANVLASSASTYAVKGGEVVQEMVKTMSAIRESSERIVDIISVIDGIAFQTNILALNAAVEAARAGDQGRGFAVVASEVRSLAQRSASAAKEIKQLIGTASEKVQRGTVLMDETGSNMEQIVVSVKQVADIISEISAAGREQGEGIDQINKAIVQIDEVTQQNAALVEEAAAAAQSMQDQAQALTRVVAVFRIDGQALVQTRPVTVAAAKPALRKPEPLRRPAVRQSRAALAVSADDASWETF